MTTYVSKAASSPFGEIKTLSLRTHYAKASLASQSTFTTTYNHRSTFLQLINSGRKGGGREAYWTNTIPGNRRNERTNLHTCLSALRMSSTIFSLAAEVGGGNV